MQGKKTEMESFLDQLPKQKEEMILLASESKKTSEELIIRSEEFSKLFQQIEELQQKVSGLVEETKAQLGVAADAKLAATFEGVQVELKREKELWFGWLMKAVLVLAIATAGIVWWQIIETGTVYHLSFPVRIAVLSPIVYFVVFINREYSRVRYLIEEYTFKAAVARSFEAYKEIVQSTDSESPVSTHSFIIESIKDLYSSPMVNVKNNTHKERENTPDMMSNIRSIMEEFFPGKNEQ
jgi:hypothetical protein